MRLAVIPARGGSKRIARKNIRLFAGKPILAYSIQAAMDCSVIDRVWVSTEDTEIAAVAREWGAEVPFLRPSSLADDHAVMQPVMQHALNYAEDAQLKISEACLIFATAPFLLPCDLAQGWNCLIDRQADLALSVTQFRSAPQRAQRMDANGYLKYNSPEYCHIRSQDLEPLYHDAAQFVWGTPHAFFNATVTDAKIAPVIVSADRVIDIDTPDDWQYAEKLYQLHEINHTSSQAA